MSQTKLVSRIRAAAVRNSLESSTAFISKHLVKFVADPAPYGATDAHCKQSVEPKVTSCRGLKGRNHAKIVIRLFEQLVAAWTRNSLQESWRRSPQAAVLQSDELSVVGT